MLRGLVVWLLIILAETAHGIARTILLAPLVGDFRARQIGVFTGAIIILAIALVSIRWIRPAGPAAAVTIGMAWLVLTLAFEVAFGRYVAHAPWSRIASDYNLARGGLLPIGMAVLAMAPLIASKVRRVS
jgi:hypothetical protein